MTMKVINYLLAASASNQSRLILLFIMSLSWWVFFYPLPLPNQLSTRSNHLWPECLSLLTKSDSGPRKISWASDPELYILFHVFKYFLSICQEEFGGRSICLDFRKTRNFCNLPACASCYRGWHIEGRTGSFGSRGKICRWSRLN
jgi:hypothetical protein